MPKTRSQKEVMLKKLEEQVSQAKSTIFVRQDGLSAGEEVELRKALRTENVEYAVVKKTLLTKALSAAGVEKDDVKTFTGTVAAAFGSEDEVAPAKVLQVFRKQHDAVKFLGGLVNGSFMNEKETAAFAMLPSKKELLGQLVSVVSGPLRGLASVLQGNLRNVVYALKAIQEQKS